MYNLYKTRAVLTSGFTFNHEKHEMYEKKTIANGAKDAQ
jgi:hypothetical protein